jgi:hypothetical protein
MPPPAWFRNTGGKRLKVERGNVDIVVRNTSYDRPPRKNLRLFP